MTLYEQCRWIIFIFFAYNLSSTYYAKFSTQQIVKQIYNFLMFQEKLFGVWAVYFMELNNVAEKGAC